MPFDTINLTGMRLESVAWGGAVLRASFGNGYGAKANVGAVSGLHMWSMHSGGVWPDLTSLLTIDGVSRFEYYWEFFKTHTTGDTDIFIIEWRDAFYHASFTDTEMSVDKFKNVLLYEGGVKIRQRRVVGETYNDDGSIDIDLTPPSVPEDLTAETVSDTEVDLDWSASTD